MTRSTVSCIILTGILIALVASQAQADDVPTVTITGYTVSPSVLLPESKGDSADHR